jgi:hypothetical protein
MNDYYGNKPRNIPGYDERVMDTSNPYYDRRLRSDKPITFLGFIDDLIRLWEAAGKPARIIRSQPIGEEAEYPLITYRTLHREVNKQFKDHKPRYRDTLMHPDIQDEFVELRGQIFDVQVAFDIHALGAEDADDLVEQFDDFIQMYKGFFKLNGVQEIMFHSQGEDQVLTDSRYPIAKRPLQYTIRFEKVTPIFLNQIEQIAVRAHIYKPQTT